MLLRNMLLNSTSFSPLFAPDDGKGAAAPAAPTGDQGDDQGDDTGVQDQEHGDDQGTGDDDGAAEGDEGGDDDAAEGDEADEGKPPVAARTAPDWRDKEIGRKHRQGQELKRRLEQAERENADLRAIAERAQRGGEGDDAGEGEQPPPRRAAPRAPALDDRAVQTAAERIVAQQRFTDDSNAADQAGRKAYGDNWDTACDRLKMLGGLEVNDMMTVLATDNPAKVLYELGNKPDNYHRIMELPEAKRFAEIVKLGLAAPKRRIVSEAPAPVDQLDGRPAGTPSTKINLYDDKTPDDKWFKAREKEKNDRFRARQGV